LIAGSTFERKGRVMATSPRGTRTRTTDKSAERSRDGEGDRVFERRTPGRQEIPIPHTSVAIHTPSLAWYAGLCVMATLEVVEWPVALIAAGTHALAAGARRPVIRNLAEGFESGA
jgi:hypothetical protein